MKLTKCMVLVAALICGQSKIVRAAEGNKILFKNDTYYTYEVSGFTNALVFKDDAAWSSTTELPITLQAAKGLATEQRDLVIRADPKPLLSAFTKGMIGVRSAFCNLSKEELDDYDLNKHGLTLVVHSAFDDTIFIEKNDLV